MHDIGVIVTITVGLSVALVTGYITHRIGLSPIVGYLLAGIAIGPYTPGFVADAKIASQLAEIGVILLMFGVGLHFHLKDLLAVRKIAIPGAVGQSIIATGLGTLVAHWFGWTLGAGIVLGIAISVASTVVLIRVLMDNERLDTPEGHIAVGWLVVEDIFTVLVLVMIPVVAGATSDHTVAAGDHAAAPGSSIGMSLAIALLKLVGLGVLMLWGGAKWIPLLMAQIARTRSRELFTLAVLVIALGIATGSALLFGASMALGAFLAGMVVGQSDVSHQAAADALPMRDAFAVLFFVSVGMLFSPHFLIERPVLVLAVLAIIMIGKPLSALFIVLVLGYPLRTALTVALSLAQIGEFSFILAELAHSKGILDNDGRNVLVATALISITINPLMFKSMIPIENFILSKPALKSIVTWRTRKDLESVAPTEPVQEIVQPDKAPPKAVVVGYGPVGKTLTRILNDFEIRPTIVDMNIDTVKRLTAAGYSAIFGDASRREILEAAGASDAKYLLVTLPDLAARFPVIASARAINSNLTIFVRARYLGERPMLEESGATGVAYEEAEIAVALAKFLLRDIGASEDAVDKQAERIRNEISMRTGFTMIIPKRGKTQKDA